MDLKINRGGESVQKNRLGHPADSGTTRPSKWKHQIWIGDMHNVNIESERNGQEKVVSFLIRHAYMILRNSIMSRTLPPIHRYSTKRIRRKI